MSDPDDYVDELALEQALASAGLSEEALARLLRVGGVNGLNSRMAWPPIGWRAQVEQALGMSPGSLKLERSDTCT